MLWVAYVISCRGVLPYRPSHPESLIAIIPQTGWASASLFKAKAQISKVLDGVPVEQEEKWQSYVIPNVYTQIKGESPRCGRDTARELRGPSLSLSLFEAKHSIIRQIPSLAMPKLLGLSQSKVLYEEAEMQALRF
jgi:hypothetical protein